MATTDVCAFAPCLHCLHALTLSFSILPSALLPPACPLHSLPRLLSWRSARSLLIVVQSRDVLTFSLSHSLPLLSITPSIPAGGVPRTSPYVRKAGASPSASAKWTPCPTNQSEQEKAQANPAVPTEAEEQGSNDDDTPLLTPAAKAAAKAKATSGSVDGGVFGNGNGPTGNAAAAEIAKTAAPQTQTSDEWETTQVQTSWVDVTSTHTWTPEPSSSSAPAPSSSAKAEEEKTFVPPSAKVAAKAPQQNNNNNNDNGNDNGGSSSSSSSQAPAYTPPAVVVPSGKNKLGVAWDWRNPKGVLNQWSGASYVYSGSHSFFG